MVSADATTLTNRQVEVLELREDGLTQQEVAEKLGTTNANISAIERAAEENVEKARQTLDLMRTLRAPVQLSVTPGTTFEDLVDRIYQRGDEAGISIDYCQPELYAHLYGRLEAYASQGEIDTALAIGITSDGAVQVFTDDI
jgi:Tfx family DNA-binding protein